MNSPTYKAVKAVLSADDTVTLDERNAVFAILNGQVPKKGPLPLLLTQKQAAYMLGVSRFTVNRMTRERELHPVKVHDRWHYCRSEIEAIANGENWKE